MRKPPDKELPLFVYGLFKPDELAYGQISEFVEGEPSEASVSGSLYVRDGLPLLELRSGGTPVRGYVLQFREADAAYRTVSQFESGKHYEWQECAPSPCDSPANVLVGRKPSNASVLTEWSEWHSDQDPVFKEGMQVVRETRDCYGTEPFQSAPPGSFDWARFFQLQMAYLLLWTILERYTSLAYGPQLKPYERRHRLAESVAYKKAFGYVTVRDHVLYDSRYPDRCQALAPTDSSSSLDYYYLIRCNLSHRGKGAFKDGEAVRLSLSELLAITDRVLDETVFRHRS